VRREYIPKKRETGASHADHHVKITRLQPFHETHRLALIFERALLHRRSDERFAAILANERVHLLRTAAFETEHAKSVERHV
jgi:hypothetical protein